MLHDALAEKKVRPEVGGSVLCSGVSLFRILSLRYDMISRFYLSLSAPDGGKSARVLHADLISSFFPVSLGLPWLGHVC